MPKVSGTVFVNDKQEKQKTPKKDGKPKEQKQFVRLASGGSAYVTTSAPTAKQEVVHQDKLEKEEAKKDLNNLAKREKIEIFSTTSVFPFDLFPDKIIIDTSKVTVVQRFLLSGYTFPMLIEDIRTARDYRGVFFSSLEIDVRGYETNPPKIRYLFHKDAHKARVCITALIEVKRRGIDLERLKKREIIKKLEQIAETLTEKEYS